MENCMFLMIMFPDSSSETVRKIQTVMDFIDELGGFIIDQDDDTDDCFIDEDDLPFQTQGMGRGADRAPYHIFCWPLLRP